MSSVYVGLSGGVDSSVAAALLLSEGHDVTGVYMKNWTIDLPGVKCPWADDLADAKRVAVQLGIPFKVFDFQAEYKQKVVDYMVAEYQEGRTPNPDIMCNQEVKFKLFLNAALEDGAEFIATGHYARISRSMKHEVRSMGNKKASLDPYFILHTSAALYMGIDANKDQSYFLYRITKDALQRSLMPIGEYKKPRIREIAAERGLVTADKKDSQGICFVGKVGMKDFLSRYVQTEPGDIVEHGTGKVLGRHDGAIFYTLGQRQGLGIGGGLPFYVTGKDMKKNIVYVTKKLNEQALWQDKLHLTSLHWIHEPPQMGKTYRVRTRYRAKLVNATVEKIDKIGMTIQLKDAERAVTPGQSTVFYEDGRVLGGGIVAMFDGCYT